MKTTTELFLSRSYVEFGPFTPDELSGFAGRGLLLESDYVKETGGHVWQPCNEWLASLTSTTAKAPEATAKASAAPAKAPARKRAAKPKAGA